MSDTRFLYTWVVIVYRCIVSLIGIPGNILILAVYWKKHALGSAQVFIQTLALSDLYVCSLVAIDVHFWLYQFEYTNELLCKVFFTMSSVGWYLSVCLTVAIAIDRWLAVCKPVNGRWSRSTAQKISIACLVVALVVNVAVPFSSHVDTREIPSGGNGTSCYKQAPAAQGGKKHTVLYFLVLLPQHISFFVAATLMCFLYFRLWRAVSKRGKHFASGRAKVVPIGLTSTINTENTSKTQITDDGSQTQQDDDPTDVYPENASTAQDLHRSSISMERAHGIEDNGTGHQQDSLSKADTETSQKNTSKRSKGHNSMTRLTLMLIVSTVVFIITWVLTIVIFSLTSLTDKFFGNSIFYAIIAVLRLSTLVNNAINPILYSFLNPRFRADCGLVFKRFRGRFC